MASRKDREPPLPYPVTGREQMEKNRWQPTKAGHKTKVETQRGGKMEPVSPC